MMPAVSSLKTALRSGARPTLEPMTTPYSRGTIAIIATNCGNYALPGHRHTPTGLWLSELSAAWDIFTEAGYEVIIASPAGGHIPLEPRSLRFPLLSRSARRWHEAHAELLETSVPLSELTAEQLAAVYLAGGHGTIFDFTYHKPLHFLVRQMLDEYRVVAAVCHGYAGLIPALDHDEITMTGFSWLEEILAGERNRVPYNIEQAAKDAGAQFRTAALPFLPFVVRDGNVVTGQNFASPAATARAVLEALD